MQRYRTQHQHQPRRADLHEYIRGKQLATRGASPVLDDRGVHLNLSFAASQQAQANTNNALFIKVRPINPAPRSGFRNHRECRGPNVSRATFVEVDAMEKYRSKWSKTKETCGPSINCKNDVPKQVPIYYAAQSRLSSRTSLDEGKVRCNSWVNNSAWVVSTERKQAIIRRQKNITNYQQAKAGWDSASLASGDYYNDPRQHSAASTATTNYHDNKVSFHSNHSGQQHQPPSVGRQSPVISLLKQHPKFARGGGSPVHGIPTKMHSGRRLSPIANNNYHDNKPDNFRAYVKGEKTKLRGQQL